MTKKRFTAEEIEILRANPYTHSVSADAIRFKKNFIISIGDCIC